METLSSLTPSIPLLVLARISGLIVTLLVLIWSISFGATFLPLSSSQETHIYSVLHPLVMVIGFIVISGEAILIHRWFPGSRYLKKSVHLCLQGVALASGMFGIWSKFHVQKGVFVNFYILHSWMGLICVFLFGAQIHKSNPGSIAICNREDGNLKFTDMCISFKAALDVFMTNDCRPTLGLDRCFLKGNYRGQCSSIISLDANNGIFPIAVFLCRSECQDLEMLDLVNKKFEVLENLENIVFQIGNSDPKIVVPAFTSALHIGSKVRKELTLHKLCTVIEMIDVVNNYIELEHSKKDKMKSSSIIHSREASSTPSQSVVATVAPKLPAKHTDNIRRNEGKLDIPVLILSPMTITSSAILPTIKGDECYRTPQVITDLLNRPLCQYHNAHSYETDNCYSLIRIIYRILLAGTLHNYVVDIQKFLDEQAKTTEVEHNHI
ncbi:hypothetical protein GIB67_013983 [Kingdonia uniflora]|uniref:Cytochrome b561 domain-containing protein n=1 Tax=Kingdonia uniflora TaxID=39325 RepID=A0A7J7LDS7_9MAGN|nr:hypothetical protein GIB67_013983 [Kingdonia uniflora]